MSIIYKGIILFLSFLLFSSCATIKNGSGYQRTIGAEQYYGHLLVMLLGSNSFRAATNEITITSNGKYIDEYQIQGGEFDVVALRNNGNSYNVKFKFNTKGFLVGGDKSSGRDEVEFTAKPGVVYGVLILINESLFNKSYSIKKQEFTGKTASFIVNPANTVLIWDELVAMNQQKDNENSYEHIQNDSTSNDIETKLLKIKKMLDEGIITDVEYQEMRKGLVDKLFNSKEK